jgi:hypothetical protein
VQYQFNPRFLNFSGQYKPQMAHIKFRDGPTREMKTADYWTALGSSSASIGK